MTKQVKTQSMTIKRSIYLITLLAFILRLGLGTAATLWLPQIGYQSKPQQAGYLFFDAYRRDNQAYDLAITDKPLAKAFNQNYASDQYGGLLWLSAFTYRYLSFGTHQPLLMIFLAALVGSLGVIFTYLAAKRLLDEKVAFLAALIFAFYPEAILLGASQMREPFLMTCVALAFYGLVEWQATRAKLPWLWMLLALAGMFFISPGIALVTLVAAAGWIYFSDSGHKIPWQALAVAAGIFLLALLALAASWDSLVATKSGGMLGVFGNWARETAKWNAYILGRSSGIVQLLFQAFPPILATPFVAVYGLLQPVLPAVIVEPAVPFWQTLGIFRALGWYLLLPLVAFAPFSAGTLPENQRPKFRWLAFLVWGWMLIAAVRGGGDQWDNPRYRVILLVWIAILAAQAFFAVKSAAGRWFWRIVAVEVVILLVFGHWYSWRYLDFGFNLGIRNTLAIAIGLSVLVVAGDWLWQRFKAQPRV
jgi:hypothetical protein